MSILLNGSLVQTLTTDAQSSFTMQSQLVLVGKRLPVTSANKRSSWPETLIACIFRQALLSVKSWRCRCLCA